MSLPLLLLSAAADALAAEDVEDTVAAVEDDGRYWPVDECEAVDDKTAAVDNVCESINELDDDRLLDDVDSNTLLELLDALSGLLGTDELTIALALEDDIDTRPAELAVTLDRIPVAVEDEEAISAAVATSLLGEVDENSANPADDHDVMDGRAVEAVVEAADVVVADTVDDILDDEDDGVVESAVDDEAVCA